MCAIPLRPPVRPRARHGRQATFTEGITMSSSREREHCSGDRSSAAAMRCVGLLDFFSSLFPCGRCHALLRMHLECRRSGCVVKNKFSSFPAGCPSQYAVRCTLPVTIARDLPSGPTRYCSNRAGRTFCLERLDVFERKRERERAERRHM